MEEDYEGKYVGEQDYYEVELDSLYQQWSWTLVPLVILFEVFLAFKKFTFS